jgi:hypothetical protein
MQFDSDRIDGGFPAGEAEVATDDESRQGEAMTVHTAPKTLLDQLAEAGIAYELLPHAAP